MKLIDNDGKEWEIKASECPAPWWIWRDVLVGVIMAFIIARQIFV